MEGEQLKEYVEFIQSGVLEEWVKENPDYTKENVNAFADKYEDRGFPRIFLVLQIRDQYYYGLRYDETPIADLWFDITLLDALDYLETKTGAK